MDKSLNLYTCTGNVSVRPYMGVAFTFDDTQTIWARDAFAAVRAHAASWEDTSDPDTNLYTVTNTNVSEVRQAA